MTGRALSGGRAWIENAASDAGSLNCADDCAENANLVRRVRAAGPLPSSLLISTREASPAALWVGSGRSTRSPSAAGGPPTEPGSRKFQPTALLNEGTWAAAGAGITIMSGDRATTIPVVWTRCAPSGNVRATSTHRLESGTQASTEGRPWLLAWPSTWAATVAGGASVTCTSTQRPSTWWLCRLKYWPTR